MEEAGREADWWVSALNSRDEVETLVRLTVAAPLVATSGWMIRVYDQRRGGVLLIALTAVALYCEPARVCCGLVGPRVSV